MTMRRWVMGAVALALALAAPTAPAMAQDDKAWSLDVGADYSTHYLFRGVPLLGDNEVLIPNATFTVGGFSAYYYGYRGDIPADFTLSGLETPYNEDDFGADYTFSIGEKFSLTLGGVAYMYSNRTTEEYESEDTYELYAIASFDVFLAPTVSYWHDMDAYEGGYMQVGISSSIPLGDKASIDWSAALGVDFGYNDADTNGDLNDLLVGIDIPVQITDWFAIHGMVQQSFALDVLEDLGVDDETVFTGGVTFSF